MAKARARKAVAPKEAFVVLTGGPGNWEVCCGNQYASEAAATKEAEEHAEDGYSDDYAIAKIIMKGESGRKIHWS